MDYKIVELDSGRIVGARVIQRRHHGKWLVSWAGITLEAMPLLPAEILRREKGL